MRPQQIDLPASWVIMALIVGMMIGAAVAQVFQP
jgi:hypothetical protein